mmetsp:Transcript_108337/g.187145  ORF Transcript_108337/g.187145 Transcript_108337/m.187145 type:complete len:88 (-) Transcript_108337:350-613(-)
MGPKTRNLGATAHQNGPPQMSKWPIHSSSSTCGRQKSEAPCFSLAFPKNSPGALQDDVHKHCTTGGEFHTFYLMVGPWHTSFLALHP